MEHRYGPRITMDCRARLYQNDIPAINCRLRDIGPEGLFIETGGASRWPRSLLDVDIEFGAGKWFKTRGLIVHTSPQGVGLLVMGADEAAFDELWRSLRRPAYNPAATLAWGAMAAAG